MQNSRKHRINHNVLNSFSILMFFFDGDVFPDLFLCKICFQGMAYKAPMRLKMIEMPVIIIIIV